MSPGRISRCAWSWSATEVSYGNCHRCGQPNTPILDDDGGTLIDCLRCFRLRKAALKVVAGFARLMFRERLAAAGVADA